MRSKIKNLLLGMLCAAMVIVAVPAFAADYSCDEEDNMVNPALALCSTHVYNVGDVKNPEDGGDKEMMKEVIALKTTVMTQQMYKQYEYLESMIKRLKTQLEKAVLTTKLQAAGASDGKSTSGGSVSVNNNRDSYVVLSDAKDCNLETGSGRESVLQCVISNISLVLNAVDENKTSEARRQLQKDIDVATNWGGSFFKKPAECGSMSGPSGIRKCANALRPAVYQAIDDYNKTYRTNNKD